MHEIAKEEETTVSDNGVPLAFLRSGYILSEYSPALGDVEFEKDCIRNLREYTK